MLHTRLRSRWLPQVTQLEDRCTPASFAGNVITLDDANEILTISTAVSGTYTLSSTVDVNGTTGPVAFAPAAGPVTVIDSATGTRVEFGKSTTEYANPFAVTLDNAPSNVLFSGASAFGANDLTVTTTQSILVQSPTNLPPIPNPGPYQVPSVTTTSGNITFSANMQATPTNGNFIGVDVRGSPVTSVSGAVSVSGRGGNAAAGGQFGVRVLSAATLGSTGSGTVTVTGIGGASTGNDNYGVQVVGGRPTLTSITSGGGNVTVTGTGGGAPETIPTGYSNRGVFVNLGGKITAGGGGAVSVTGTGGRVGTEGNSGVYVTDSGSEITSGGGDVSVTGSVGNLLSAATSNHGVIVASGGRITAGGNGSVGVSGRGTTNANAGGSGGYGSVGVYVTGGSAITSSGGPINIQGTGGSRLGVALHVNGTIASGSNAPITITSNSLDVFYLMAFPSLNSRISAGIGTVTIQPLTPTTEILIQAQIGRPGGPNRLGLDDDLLDQVTAGTLVIGRSDAGNITLNTDITRPTGTAMRVITGGDFLGLGRIDTGGGPLTLSVGGSISPRISGNDLIASSTTFTAGADLTLPINGTDVARGGYTQLIVGGSLDLTGLSLVLPGSYVPVVGDVFTLVVANSIAGTFTGLPDGATVSLNGATLRVNYTATAVTATAVSSPSVRVVTAVGDTVRVLNPANGSTRTFVPFPGFTVSVAAADLNNDGVPDVIIGAGPGGGPHVRAFDGATSAELASFFAFDVSFRGGVNVAAGGGFVALGAGAGGGPHVKVIAANRLNSKRADGVIADAVAVANFFAFDVSFAGGVSVALGDVTSDGTADLVVGAGAGGGPHVKVIDGSKWSQPRTGVVIDDSTTVASFFAFEPSFGGGVNVGATGGRFAVGAGAGGEPQVKVYRVQGGLVEERNDRAFDPAFRGGVRVGFADIDADGDVDLLTGAGPGGGPHLKAFNISPFGLVRSEFVADPTDTRGVVV